MRYMVERNFVQIVGKGWYNQPIAMELPLREYDLENIGEFTRENIEDWLCKNAGDFSTIEDFFATAGDSDIEWKSEEGMFAYQDMVYPTE